MAAADWQLASSSETTQLLSFPKSTISMFQNKDLPKYNSRTITVKTPSASVVVGEDIVYSPSETRIKALAIALLLGDQNPVLGEINRYNDDKCHEEARRLAKGVRDARYLTMMRRFYRHDVVVPDNLDRVPTVYCYGRDGDYGLFAATNGRPPFVAEIKINKNGDEYIDYGCHQLPYKSIDVLVRRAGRRRRRLRSRSI